MKVQPKFYYPRLLLSTPFIIAGLILYLLAVVLFVGVDGITGVKHSKHLFSV